MKKIGDPSPEKDGLSQEYKNLIDNEIAKYGLSADVINSLFSISPISHVKPEDIGSLQTYEEYLSSETGADFRDYVMSRSNPAKIEKWNSKIRAFNEELKNGIPEKDRVQAFYYDMIEFLKKPID